MRSSILFGSLLGTFLVSLVSLSSAQPMLDGLPPTSSKAETFMNNARPRVERQLSAKGMRLGEPVFMRIFKQSKQLEVWVRKNGKFELFKTYPICAYSGTVGPKMFEGDLQSPEGFYTVSGGQLNPLSNYHLSFDIGYPNAVDRENSRTGGAIMVHGKCISQGCFAMGNLQVEELYLLGHQAFLQGQKQFSVHVFPFRMTKDNMQRNKNSNWADFWENLREGYELFEQERQVPIVKAEGGKYVFRKVPQPQNSVVMINQRIDIQDKTPGRF
ncbi:L,D-transpeptidase family protein [Candidatus Electronema sp. TJ]|uniref:L,D-transpeptidase family protein n=1 Tax=Candidatus Electronema sp. TJ TaxID=3401573 RepID=UPI003AA87137